METAKNRATRNKKTTNMETFYNVTMIEKWKRNVFMENIRGR